MKLKLSLAVGLILVLLASVPVGAQVDLPWTTIGMTTIDGQAAADGTLVQARNPANGHVCGQGQYSSGSAKYLISAILAASEDPNCFQQGDPVDFWVFVAAAGDYVKALPATQSWKSGVAEQINLSVICSGFVAPPGVGPEDVQDFAVQWRQQSGNPGWDYRYDLNDTGAVNILDVMEMAARIGQVCP